MEICGGPSSRYSILLSAIKKVSWQIIAFKNEKNKNNIIYVIFLIPHIISTELHNMPCLPDNISTIKPRRMKWICHVCVCMCNGRGVICSEKFSYKSAFVRTRNKWADHIKTDVKDKWNLIMRKLMMNEQGKFCVCVYWNDIDCPSWDMSGWWNDWECVVEAGHIG